MEVAPHGQEAEGALLLEGLCHRDSLQSRGHGTLEGFGQRHPTAPGDDSVGQPAAALLLQQKSNAALPSTV